MQLHSRSILRPWRLFRAVQARWRERRLIKRNWYDTSLHSESPAVFIGGCPRSGTTLLREILSRHSALCAGVESALLVPPFDHRRVADLWGIRRAHLQQMVQDSASVVELADTLYGELMTERGTQRWVEKSTTNITIIDRLLTWFPNAFFVHILRDGRDVACSLRHHPKEEMVRGQARPVLRDNPIDVCAHWWLYYVVRGLAFAGHPRVVEIRYENLVSRPHDTVRELCAIIGEEYEPAMLDTDAPSTEARPPAWYVNSRNACKAISTASIGRWKAELGRTERRLFVDVAGELLVTLGYAPDHSWVDDDAAASVTRATGPSGGKC